jgi:DNA adenine methylase
MRFPQKTRCGTPANVAGIPYRSPFRYPGGKTWLIPHIRQWLAAKQQTQPSRLVEPFAGGATVTLTTGFENLTRHAVFSELDPSVAAVWKIVLSSHAEWLADKILKFQPTESEIQRVLSQTATTPRDLAFQTLLKNRVRHHGTRSRITQNR